MSKTVRIRFRENEIPPALYRRIFEARQIKRASSDIRALAMITIQQQLPIESLHETYVGSTEFNVEFSLGPSALAERISQMVPQLGLTNSQSLIKLVIAGWFHKTNPNATPVQAATEPGGGVSTGHPTAAVPKALEQVPSNPHAVAMNNQMMDSIMANFGV